MDKDNLLTKKQTAQQKWYNNLSPERKKQHSENCNNNKKERNKKYMCISCCKEYRNLNLHYKTAIHKRILELTNGTTY